MAGEVETVREGMALAKEALPLFKEVFGMFGQLMGLQVTGAQTPTPSSDDQVAVLKRIATALEGIQAAMERAK